MGAVPRFAEPLWETVPPAIKEAVHPFATVEARVPDWSAVGLEEGLDWVLHLTKEGYYVDFQVDEQDPTSCVLWLKFWEYGDPEPGWAEVRASWRDGRQA
jgi:hypothetical protein